MLNYSMFNGTLAVMVMLLFFCPTGSSHTEQVITLKDGSQIKGDLISVKDGSYTIKSPLMGEVIVNSDQVANITNPQAAPPPTAAPLTAPGAAAGTMDSQIQAAQNRLMADPQMISELQMLVQDPEIAQLLTDPALMQAVMAKNPAALQNNPKAQALMQNPKMRALMDRLRK